MVPDRLARNVAAVRGKAGVEWLDRLPALVAECEGRWSFTTQQPYADLSYSYVAPAVMADGREVVLKLGVPHPEFSAEIEALRAFAGRGCATLLDSDAAKGIILLERLKPGQQLAELDDDQATSIAAGVMRQVLRPPPPQHSFPTLADWTRGLQTLRNRFDGATGPFPADLVQRAEALLSELLASIDEPLLLHGDLHHYNILSAEREPWLAIDPKGLVGEAEFEPLMFLRNRLNEPDPANRLARRVDRFVAELGLDRQRLVGWAQVQAVVWMWWTYEDESRVSDERLALASLVAEL